MNIYEDFYNRVVEFCKKNEDKIPKPMSDETKSCIVVMATLDLWFRTKYKMDGLVCDVCNKETFKQEYQYLFCYMNESKKWIIWGGYCEDCLRTYHKDTFRINQTTIRLM